MAIVSAVCTVTFRSPVYCALWFALSLLGTAGIFMVQGAQFLGVATVVVYAGAILVTFLFVLMLAQPGGDAYYDRVSWEGMLAATTGAVIVGVLTMTIVRVFNPPRDPNVLATIADFDLSGDGPNLSPDHVRRANLWRDQSSEEGRWTLELDLADVARGLWLGTKRASSHVLLSAYRRSRLPKCGRMISTCWSGIIKALSRPRLGTTNAVYARGNMSPRSAVSFSVAI